MAFLLLYSTKLSYAVNKLKKKVWVIKYNVLLTEQKQEEQKIYAVKAIAVSEDGQISLDRIKNDLQLFWKS